MEPMAAWDALFKADKMKDTAMFREMLWEYGRVTDVNVDGVEETLREANMNFHLVAVVRLDPAASSTNRL